MNIMCWGRNRTNSWCQVFGNLDVTTTRFPGDRLYIIRMAKRETLIIPASSDYSLPSFRARSVEVLVVGRWMVCVPDVIGCCPVAGAACWTGLFLIEEAIDLFLHPKGTNLSLFRKHSPQNLNSI